MDFAQSMIEYYKGEWLEATLLAAFGLVCAGTAVAIWINIDSNAQLRGLFYPIVFLALLSTLAGGYNAYNNSQRLAVMPVQYAENPKTFVENELNRFEGKSGVNAWWLPLKLLWAVLIVAGLVATFFTRSDVLHGVAIGLIIIGATGLVIDGFAHHRAKIYTQALVSVSGYKF